MNGRILMVGTMAMSLASAAMFAATRIDQEQVNVDTGITMALGGSDEQKLAQVFTANATGSLTHVTVPIMCEPSAVLRVGIETVRSGSPNGNVLAQEVLSGALFPSIVASPGVGFRIVQFPNPAYVSAGGRYAIVLEAFKSTCAVYRGPIGDTYLGGVAYFDARPNNPGWIPMLPAADLAFQTFVE